MVAMAIGHRRGGEKGNRFGAPSIFRSFRKNDVFHANAEEIYFILSKGKNREFWLEGKWAAECPQMPNADVPFCCCKRPPPKILERQKRGGNWRLLKKHSFLERGTIQLFRMEEGREGMKSRAFFGGEQS
jgi:hypothetical protein